MEGLWTHRCPRHWRAANYVRSWTASMRTVHGALGFFALTLASWPGGPSAQARITAHGALIDEQSNSEHASILAPPDDIAVDSFDAVMVNTQERATIRLVGT